MRQMVRLIAMTAAIAAFGYLVVAPTAANAALTSTQEQLCKSSGNIAQNKDGKDPTPSNPAVKCVTADGRELAGDSTSYLSAFINFMLYLAGAVAVIVIIVGGIRYVTSTGDAMRIKQAKDTVLYGVVGLLVALLAYGIVNSVVKDLGGQ